MTGIFERTGQVNAGQSRVWRGERPEDSARGQAENAKFDFLDTRFDHADLASRGLRQVDRAAFLKRAAIIDANLDRAAVLEIGHANHCSKGQGRVGGGEMVGVESFAGSSFFAVKTGAVP